MKEIKKLILLSSLIVCLVLLIEAVKDNVSSEWRTYQDKYKVAMLKAATTDTEKKLAMNYSIKMRQIVLPDLNRSDRCVSCHVGMEDPRMADMPNPIKSHPGNYLETHDVEKVGCTICHDGQGRALTSEEAHANEHGFYWEQPLLKGSLIEANCARCHSAGVAENDQYNRGKVLFEKNDCLRCHKANGKGGGIGPDLTNISNASPHTKMPVPANREELLKKFNGNVNVAYLYEAVIQPKVQPANSIMPDFFFNESEAEDLAVYLKSLSVPMVPKSVMSVKGEKLPHLPEARGARLYVMYCKGCHGIDGEGRHLPDLKSIAPAIGNQEFQAIADNRFFVNAISYGRGGQMSPYISSGGLSTEEISDLVAYLKTFKNQVTTFDEIKKMNGNAEYGRTFFNGNCANCHGVEGRYTKDSIGPTLRNPALLGFADDKFWYTTITKGREGTAMPSWHFLSKDQLADLLAYLGTFREENLSTQKVLELVKSPSTSVAVGETLYKGNCAICHATDGIGALGPNLANPEFQGLADASFILRVIKEGRDGTAMPSWNHMSNDDVASIIKYVKTLQNGSSAKTSSDVVSTKSSNETSAKKTSKESLKAKPEVDLTEIKKAAEAVKADNAGGKEIFETVCAQCHGSRDRNSTRMAPAILSKGFLSQASDRFIREIVKNGRSGTQMRANLQGKGGVVEISAEQINSVVAYIRSFETDPLDLRGVATVAGDAKIGAYMFKTNCSQCHGEEGQGGNGPGLAKPGFLSQVSDGFIMGMARMGRNGSEMRAFTPYGGDGFSNMTEKDLSDIVAFLRSNVDRATVTGKTVRGVVEVGQLIFETNCAQCHGKKGKGGLAPALGNKVFMTKIASDSYLQATMALGRHNTQMRSMMTGGGGVVELNAPEVNNVISYLKSLQ